MSIEIKEAKSEEIKKCIKDMEEFRKSFAFDENIGKIQWDRTPYPFDGKFLSKKYGVSFSTINLGTSNAIVVTPRNIQSEGIILYIHGGGFVSGSAESSMDYCSTLAKYSGIRVVAINYSLAPEKAFPNALDDCIKAYTTIQSLYPNAKIALLGESAGGNLCLVTTLKLKSLNLKMPSCLVLHSPMVDFSGSLDRTMHEINDFTIKEEFLKPLCEIYVKGIGKKDPFLSPIYGDFTNFPPVFISCDFNEWLFADSMTLYEKCQKQGVDVHMVEMKNSFHSWAMLGSETPETLQLLKENVDFIWKHCGENTTT